MREATTSSATRHSREGDARGTSGHTPEPEAGQRGDQGQDRHEVALLEAGRAVRRVEHGLGEQAHEERDGERRERVLGR